jgi:hypothetical protein
MTASPSFPNARVFITRTSPVSWSTPNFWIRVTKFPAAAGYPYALGWETGKGLSGLDVGQGRGQQGHQHVFHDPSPTRNRYGRADQYGWSRSLEGSDGPDENPHRGTDRPNEVTKTEAPRPTGYAQASHPFSTQRRYLANANAQADARACIPYQTRQAFTWTIGCPARQPKAWANSGILPSTLFTRYRARECPCVMTAVRATSGRTSPHHTLA